jgi:hypothetical protein
MGSSRSSFGNERYSASDYLDKIKQSENQAKVQQYEVEINEIIDDLLSKFNNRDNEAINRHVEAIKNALNKEIEGTVSSLFGGSLSKNTHITGLSDVDTLVILNKSDLKDKTPQQVLTYFYNRLKARFPDIPMKKGDTAITVSFKDGDVQLLPAIHYKGGLKIPDGKDWSSVIKPTVFSRSLTVLNQRLNGRLIPTIKIIKGIISKVPENMRLSGYHIESLALQIFGKNLSEYKAGVKNKDLIKDFFREASNQVRVPIKDVTKQSKTVDEYLGPKNSIQRLMVADVLDRNYRKMELADSSRLVDMWKDVLKINQ